MTTVTEYQRQLAQSMIDVLPDEVKLLDVLTAGALFLSNATTQSPYCTVNFDQAFSLIATVTGNLIKGKPVYSFEEMEGGAQ